MDMTSSYVKTDDSSVVTDNDSCTKSDREEEDDSELYDNHPKVRCQNQIYWYCYTIGY